MSATYQASLETAEKAKAEEAPNKAKVRREVTSSNRSPRSGEVSGLFVVLVSRVGIVVDETVLGRHHVEYHIEFQNLKTGQKKSVCRRYRQILKWYQEVRNPPPAVFIFLTFNRVDSIIFCTCS